MGFDYVQLPWWRRATFALAALVRLLVMILMIPLSVAAARWCVLWLIGPPDRLVDEPAGAALGFRIYWILIMLALAIFFAAIAVDLAVSVIHRLFPFRQMDHLAANVTKAFHVAGQLCRFLLAGGMVSACITGLVMLPGRWSGIDAQTFGEVLAMTIGLPIWGGLAAGWAIMEIARLIRRFRHRRGDDDEPPRRPFNGDPVPAPREPDGPRPLAAHATPPQG